MINIPNNTWQVMAIKPRAKGNRAARDERISRWIMRLALPLVIYLSGQVLYWIWIDNAYGPPGLAGVLSGVPLLIVAVAATIWAVGIWCSCDLH